MSNLSTFLKIYKDLARESFMSTPEEIAGLYMDLKERVDNNAPSLQKWFQKAVPSRLEMVLSIDAVAHEIHKNGDETLQSVYPGSRVSVAKSVLDQLSGLEVDSEVRKSSRGYFSNILNEAKMIFLEKQEEQVGLTTKEAVKGAIKEYEKLFKAGLASPAETLTLSRYYPDDAKYQVAIMEKGLIESQPVVVGGPASVELVDKEGHLITTDALDKSFDKFISNPRYANIMIMHTDVQVAHALPAYITASGRVYKSGVDDVGLWLISELREDLSIANKVIEKIDEGEIQSYSIAGSATDTEDVYQQGRKIKKVHALELAEVTLCAKGINQGAYFNVLKADPIKAEDIIGGKLENTTDYDAQNKEDFKEIKREVAQDIKIKKEDPEEIIKRIKNGEMFDDMCEAYEEVDYRPSSDDGKECHICEFYSEGFCTYLEYPVDPEYVCDEFEPMPNSELAEKWAEAIGKPYEEQERVEKSALNQFIEFLNKQR